MNKKKVSIIVPFYGVEKYIDKCLDSLVNQTLNDIEIIVINDESPDNSEKIVKKYLKKHPDKIKYLEEKNGGQGYARNNGLKHANGEYILYVDSDDYIDYTMCEKLYNQAKKNNNDIVVCGNYEVDEEYKIISQDSSYSYNDHDNLLFNKFYQKPAVWNKLFKREYLLKNKSNFRSKLWYEDFDFTEKLLINTNNISFIDEPLYYYLIRNGSTMNNKNIERNNELIYAVDELYKFYKNKQINKEDFDVLEFICIYHIFMSGIARLIKNFGYRKSKHIIKSYRLKMEEIFPNFKNNKYIKKMDFKKKVLFYLIKFNLYFLIEFLVNIY